MKSNDSFAPKPIRILAIIHLCLVFSVIGWIGLKPFLQDYFSVHSQISLIRTLKGVGEGSSPEKTTKQVTSKKEIVSSSEFSHGAILAYEEWLEMQADHGFSRNIKNVANYLFIDMPILLRAWLFFSIVICIMLLLKKEGARQATWILPAILLLLGLFTLSKPQASKISLDENLFPAESIIVQHYLKEPLSPKILTQREQLLQGWHRYLIQNWGRDLPSEDPTIFNQQLGVAEFRFALARLEAQKADYAIQNKGKHDTPLSFPFIALGFLWSLGFAWGINKKAR